MLVETVQFGCLYLAVFIARNDTSTWQKVSLSTKLRFYVVYFCFTVLVLSNLEILLKFEYFLDQF